MRRIFWLSAVMAVMAAGTAARGAGGGGGGGGGATAPATQAGGERWRATLRELSSADFAERQAGKKELAKATWRDREVLQKLAEGTTDLEIKRAMAEEVAALDEQIALAPPPISFDLDHGDLKDAVAELSRSLGVHFYLHRNSVDAPPFSELTLHVKDRPFSEVYLALCGAAALQPDSSGVSIFTEAPGLHAASVSGPFMVCPRGTMVEPPANLHGRPPELRLLYSLIVDPRVPVAGYYRPQFTSIVDDAGQELLLPPRPGAANERRSMRGQWVLRLDEVIAADPAGKAIVSAKGVVHLDVAVAQRSVEVADLQKSFNSLVDLGDYSVKFGSILTTGGGTRISAALHLNVPPGALYKGPSNPIVPMTLTDADERLVWSGNLNGNLDIPIVGEFPPPLKLVMAVPTRIKSVDVPFELKGIALP